MSGDAPVFFRDGKGAAFLADIRNLRHKFTISQEPMSPSREFVLKLVPKEQSLDLDHVLLMVTPEYEIAEVATINTYGDETRIEFTQLNFDSAPTDDLFEFSVPAGVDVVKLVD